MHRGFSFLIVCCVVVLSAGCVGQSYSRYTYSDSTHQSVRVKSATQNLKLKSDIKGPVEFSENGSEIVRLGPDDVIRYSDYRAGTELVISMGNDEVNYAFKRDGKLTSLNASERDAQMAFIFSHTPALAPQRVAFLYQTKGLDSVLEQIIQGKNNATVQAYLLSAVSLPDLTSEQQLQLIELFDQSSSDVEQASIVRNFVDHQVVISEQNWLVMIDTFEQISSDHTLSELMKDIASKLPSQAKVIDAFLEATDSVGSDYDKSQLILTLAKQAHQIPLNKLLDASLDVGSDYDARSILTGVAASIKTNEEFDSVLRLAETIGSDYDLRQALSELDFTQLTQTQVARVIAFSSNHIGSDYDLSQLLVHIAQQTPYKDELNVQFKTALRHIGSDHDKLNVYKVL